MNDSPIMAKNYYMSPIYFFGWQEIASDMEAQNYFLADKENPSAANTIKIYPSLDTKSDITRKYRDAQPSELGITVMRTGFLSSVQFWGATYFRLWECLYEGEQVSLFGILSYDTNTGQASVDETMAMIVNGAKDKIQNLFKREAFGDWRNFIKGSLTFLAITFAVGFCTNFIFKRLRELRLRRDREVLAR